MAPYLQAEVYHAYDRDVSTVQSITENSNLGVDHMYMRLSSLHIDIPCQTEATRTEARASSLICPCCKRGIVPGRLLQQNRTWTGCT